MNSSYLRYGLGVVAALMVSGCAAESATDNDVDSEEAVGEASEAVAYTSLGGTLAPGSGAGAASWGGGRIDVFVRGGNDALYHKASADGTTYSGWDNLGGTCSSDPAAVSWGSGRLDVFVRGGTALWHKAYAGNAWSDWEGLGGTCTSGPAVASWGSGRLDVFVNGGANLWQKYYSNGTWSGWGSLGSAGGGAFTSDPAAVSWGPNRIDIFDRGADNALYHRAWDGSTWTAWESLGGVLSSGPTVSSDGVGHLDVFVRGGDQMWRKSYRAEQGTWTDWISLGTASMTSDPEAISSAPGKVDLFGQGGDGTLVHSPGPFVSVPNQVPTDRIGTFNHYHNGAMKPPASYGRGVGTVPDTCPPDQDKDGGLCYPKCSAGYHGVGPVCWGECPSGYTDTGALCTYSDGPLTTTCSWNWFTCECPPNYTNAGLFCAANTVSKSSYGRGAGYPLECAPGLENDASLCYGPCDPGYTGHGPVCWLDEIDSDAVCAALYDSTLAASAKAQNKTMTFGFGVGMAAGLGFATETGVVYGRGGEYGCYISGCFVQVTDVAIQAWGSFGVYGAPFSSVAGDSTVTSLGAGVQDPVGVTQGMVSVDGSVIGGVTNVSLGISLSPYSAGLSECTTTVRQIW